MTSVHKLDERKYVRQFGMHNNLIGSCVFLRKFLQMSHTYRTRQILPSRYGYQMWKLFGLISAQLKIYLSGELRWWCERQDGIRAAIRQALKTTLDRHSRVTGSHRPSVIFAKVSLLYGTMSSGCPTIDTIVTTNTTTNRLRKSYFILSAKN